MITLDASICSSLESSSSREWLETNGIGGYASGTISGANSRRYHGLLVAATKPPLGRVVLLSKFEVTAIIDGRPKELSSNRYPDAVFPQGYKHISRFRLDPFPVWTYLVDGIEIEQKVFMISGENSTVVGWRTASRAEDDVRAVELEIRPLVVFRDHHHLRDASVEFNSDVSIDASSAAIMPEGGMPTLYLNSNADSIHLTGETYRNFEYAIEEERGFDFREDLLQPCVFRFDLSTPAAVIASTEKVSADLANEFEKAELKRRAKLVAQVKTKDEFSRQLALAADQFIVDRGKGKTVIAGYPWFSDWGRDTMIALPGLTLATNRPEVAKSIMTQFAEHISEGMIPNRFPDEGETPDYNTVDATLWFFEAIRAYQAKTGDSTFVREVLYDKLVDVLDWHIRGTRHNIHVDTDGLLYAGEPGVQLTWMDAKIGDWVVTPRTGKPVEIQALWFNALRIMTVLADEFGDSENSSRFADMAEVASFSFNGQFWNAEAECLFDVVDSDFADPSIRPNQIFAVSLFHSMLAAERARKVVDKVEAELLTPVGVRSLSPNDERYVGTYIGSPLDRDASYHQGTVWGWLIGPFIDAFRKTHLDEPDVETRVVEMLNGLKDHLSDGAIGQISEIFDADHPHLPRGCAAQAWSVAEVLRVTPNKE